MSSLYQFAMLLDDLVPEMVSIDGRIYLDRHRRGLAGITEAVQAYPNADEAQKWLNLVPIDDLLDQVTDDWSMDDPSIEVVAAVYRRAWKAIAVSAFERNARVDVEVLKDPDSGDVCLRLVQIA